MSGRRSAGRAKSVTDSRVAVRERHGFPPRHALGIGVDARHTTKGIEERFRAVARLLEIIRAGRTVHVSFR